MAGGFDFNLFSPPCFFFLVSPPPPPTSNYITPPGHFGSGAVYKSSHFLLCAYNRGVCVHPHVVLGFHLDFPVLGVLDPLFYAFSPPPRFVLSTFSSLMSEFRFFFCLCFGCSSPPPLFVLYGGLPCMCVCVFSLSCVYVCVCVCVCRCNTPMMVYAHQHSDAAWRHSGCCVFEYCLLQHV